MSLFCWLRNLWRGPGQDPEFQQAVIETHDTASESLGTAVRRQEAVSRLHAALERHERMELDRARRRLRGGRC